MNNHRPTIASRHGMVAAAHPLAAGAGASILAQGGNAFDAVAAIGAMLNVVEPFMSGMAGLGLATMWVAAERRVRVLDFVPSVPQSFPAGRFKARQDLERGALAVAPPGNLTGWCSIAQTYGRLGLPALFAPAAAVANDGFPLLDFGAYEFAEQAQVMAGFPALHENWAAAYGTDAVPQIGTVIRQPDLARTLTALGEHGPAHFYSGALGERIVAHIAACGGTLTMEDLRAVQPVWKEPVSASYRGLHVHMPPPPCESFQILLALRLLEGVDFAALARNGVEHLDMVFRAIRLAAGMRIADNNPSPETLRGMLSDASIDRARMRLLDGAPVDGPTEQWVPKPEEAAKPFNTTSFSVADREGNLICVTQSLGSPFGSGVVVPGTGVCLNNFLYWADVQPDSPNLARPGADLPICMAPSISLRDGAPVLALGTPGSYGILQTQVQAMVQYVDYGLPLQHAIDAPRGRLTDGRAVAVEDRIAADVIKALCDRGHDATSFGVDWTMKVGGMQAVSLDPVSAVMTGAADPRRDGHVAVP
jgi:gamma-glutamyltranspeptidase/glutathione hydrolase